MIAGTCFVDLSAAKHTVNQKLLFMWSDEKICDGAPTTTRGHESGTGTYSWSRNTRQHTMCITAEYHTYLHPSSESNWRGTGCTYRNNSLHVNSDRTKIIACHLRHREVKRSLKVSWNGVDLENTALPKYLDVIFDMTLSYNQHVQNTKMNVAYPHNLLKNFVIS